MANSRERYVLHPDDWETFFLKLPVRWSEIFFESLIMA